MAPTPPSVVNMFNIKWPPFHLSSPFVNTKNTFRTSQCSKLIICFNADVLNAFSCYAPHVRGMVWYAGYGGLVVLVWFGMVWYGMVWRACCNGWGAMMGLSFAVVSLDLPNQPTNQPTNQATNQAGQMVILERVVDCSSPLLYIDCIFYALHGSALQRGIIL